MPDLGFPELAIIAVIVLLLFGPGKAADIGGSLGKSIREFRRASRDDDGGAPQLTATSSNAAVESSGASGMPTRANADGGRFCRECGNALRDGQRFCVECGTPTGVAV